MGTSEMSNPVAIWDISLDCTCPRCEKDIDLLDDSDFLDGRFFTIGEYGTNWTSGVDVECPVCGHEYKVDFEY